MVHEVDFTVPATVSGLPWYDGKPENYEASDLRYYLFASRVDFTVAGSTIMGPRHGLPLFDLLCCIAWVVDDIRDGRLTRWDFTESGDRVRFRPLADGTVQVTFLEGRSDRGVRYFLKTRTARAHRDELVEALTAFVESGLRLLIGNVPGLQRNPHVQALATGPATT